MIHTRENSIDIVENYNELRISCSAQNKILSCMKGYFDNIHRYSNITFLNTLAVMLEITILNFFLFCQIIDRYLASLGLVKLTSIILATTECGKFFDRNLLPHSDCLGNIPNISSSG